ncbi:hypothetical protein [Leifsonia poae]|uniref:Uncharacterized protein n=1 Tax=Leifsonia poae TaxID=110933 RepID=A0A9W6M062_9MICO|nr:hypothetical protein [Leifsonia poae]GLJ76397.1 hypothetical protein GCM10017584_19710 [Leifsonia poae]
MGTIQRATIEAKFTRASSLIADLSTRIENQIGALWTTYEEPDPASHQIETRFRALSDLPHEWSTIDGGIIHSGRLNVLSASVSRAGHRSAHPYRSR